MAIFTQKTRPKVIDRCSILLNGRQTKHRANNSDNNNANQCVKFALQMPLMLCCFISGISVEQQQQQQQQQSKEGKIMFVVVYLLL